MKQRLWQENVSKTNVKQTKGNERSYPYLYPIGDLGQGSIHRGFHVCIDQGSFLKNFLNNNELKLN
jgi:hypothetical protein